MESAYRSNSGSSSWTRCQAISGSKSGTWRASHAPSLSGAALKHAARTAAANEMQNAAARSNLAEKTQEIDDAMPSCPGDV